MFPIPRTLSRRLLAWAVVSVAVFSVAFGSSARGAVFVVPIDFDTIQEAIAASSNGDTIYVGPGTYFENIDFLGKSITVESTEGPELTTIDGSALTDGPGFGSVVRFLSGETTASVLRGFTLTGGTGTSLGGDSAGGAIACVDSSPIIEGNVITGNTAEQGGGVFAQGLPSPRIRSNVIRLNDADTGGGLYIEEAGPMVIGNLIAENTATGPGGGLYVFFLATPTITCNTIVGNSASLGGGIAFDLFGDGNVYDSIIWGNTTTSGAGVSTYVATSQPTVSFSDVQGGWTGNTSGGNVDLDPQFVDVLAGDYRLLGSSPVINLGDNGAPFVPKLDLLGNERIVCTVVDMGAYEVPAPPTGCPGVFVRGDCNDDAVIDVTDAVAVLSYLFLSSSVTCLDACDMNSDLTLDVSDAFYLLASQFIPGSPLPADPYPNCGLSPSMGTSLGCATTVACP